MDALLLAVVSAIVGGVVVMVSDVFRDGVRMRRVRRGQDHDVARRAEVRDMVDAAVAPMRAELIDLRDEVAGLTGLISARPRRPREDRP